MNTLEIDAALKTNIYTKKYFVGVFPIDKIPKKIKYKPSLMVINTDKSNQPGTHWQAIFIPKHGCIEFFDSYARLQNDNYLIKFLKENNNCIRLNNKQIQSFYSNVCGHYCCLFLLHRIKNKSFKNFVMQFNSMSLEENDKKAVNKFNLNFNLNIKKRKSKQKLQSCCMHAEKGRKTKKKIINKLIFCFNSRLKKLINIYKVRIEA